MKRLVCLLLALIFCALSAACGETPLPAGEGDKKTPSVGPDRLNPLFRLSAYEGQSAPETRYYATENGFCYLAKTAAGYTCGFFALPNLISNEDLFTTRAEPSEIYDLGEDKALCLAGEKLWFLSLDAGSGVSFETEGKLKYSAAPVFGADKALYYETDRFLLTAALTFSGDFSDLEIDELVVMPKEKLEKFGFTRILCVSADGERLYYAYEQNGVTGYAYFGVGYRAEALGRTDFDFVFATPLSGTTKVLFESRLEGRRVFTLKDLDANTEHSVTLPAGTAQTAFCTDRSGKFLCGYEPGADSTGGKLILYAFETGQKVREYELAHLAVNGSFALSDAADYLVVGLYDDGTGYEDHGGETVTSIEIGA